MKTVTRASSWISIPYDIIANSLRMSVDTLADVLLVFELRGLIEPHAPAGLRLKDIAALEAIADGVVPDGWFSDASPSHLATRAAPERRP